MRWQIEKKMDQFPSELLNCIFHYIDQLPDLIRASLICRHWRSSIVNNEHFLNTWFHRSLQRCRQPALNDPLADYTNNRERRLTQIVDQSLFPSKLQSSEYYLLPIIDPFHLSDAPHHFEYRFPPSLFKGFHSFSFWIFLPDECQFAVKIGYAHVLRLDTCLQHKFQWHLEKKRKISLDDRWTHIVIANYESKADYQVWINGQDCEELDLPHNWEGHIIRSNKENAVLLSCKRKSYSIHSPIASRIADLVAFKRCLSMVEIRAIYEQQAAVDQVQIGTHVKKQDNQNQPE